MIPNIDQYLQELFGKKFNSLYDVITTRKTEQLDKPRGTYAAVFRKYGTRLPNELKMLDDEKLTGGLVIRGRKYVDSVVFYSPTTILNPKGAGDIELSLENKIIPICRVDMHGEKRLPIPMCGVAFKDRIYTYYEIYEQSIMGTSLGLDVNVIRDDFVTLFLFLSWYLKKKL